MSAIANLFTSTLAGIATAQSNSPFQQCVKKALSHDDSLYSFPQDILYQVQDVKIYNLDYPVIPAAVVYPKTTQQTSDVVVCAREAGIPIQARSGGHSYCNYGRGGENGYLSVDMKNRKEFTYNHQDHTITFGPGNRLQDLTNKMKPFGRTMAYGPSGHIGSGGHMTIGGIGVLGRQLGLGVDQVVEAECVLSNGTVVMTSATSSSDLFWAIRGAGFSFAIVTRFTMRTAPAPGDIVQFSYNITTGNAKALASTFRAWQDFVAQPHLTRRFGCTLSLFDKTLVFGGTYFGPRGDFNQLNLRRVLPGGDSKGLNVQSSVATKAFKDVESFALDAFGGIPAHFYAKSLKTTNRTLLSERAIDAMFNYIETADKGPVPWFITWDLEGGAIADVPQTSTAYWNRDAVYFMQSYVISPVGKTPDTSKRFLSGLNAVVQRETGIDDSAYPGYVDNQLQHPQKAYWGGNLERLERVKAMYDPENVIRNPQSVRPARGA
ncbi:FAD-binding domain-containing [Lecanosticta acicola]|uniref:FAD-binding domain-containing n=1 Tax=Lecanosticta acicola TaxID=111012 RepID=A0AAI9E9M5_9PEZI|nr:FAD-binding domain-containing [Lecanosticta acicola]